jgi:hypothetical protein
MSSHDWDESMVSEHHSVSMQYPCERAAYFQDITNIGLKPKIDRTKGSAGSLIILHITIDLQIYPHLIYYTLYTHRSSSSRSIHAVPKLQ